MSENHKTTQTQTKSDARIDGTRQSIKQMIASYIRQHCCIVCVAVALVIVILFSNLRYWKNYDFRACGIISLSVLFIMLIAQGFLNRSDKAFTLTKGEVRRALAVSITTLYILLIPLIIDKGMEGNANQTIINIKLGQTIDSLHYVILSVFGFYFGFRFLDNWVRYKTLRQIVSEPEILEEILKKEDLASIIHEVLNVKVKKEESSQQNSERKL